MRRPHRTPPIHLSLDSKKTLDRVRKDLVVALRARGFAIVAVKDVGHRGPGPHGDPPRASFVYEVRDPHQRPADFSDDPEKAAEVPHRIAVFEMPDGSTRIATLRPTRLADLVGESDLQSVAAIVERALEEILAAAAR